MNTTAYSKTNHQHDKRPRPKIPVDKSNCKCLADVVLLYIRYACSNLIDNHKRMQDYAEYLYTELVRGEIVGNPRSVAAGIIYTSAVMTKTYGVSQDDIADRLYISTSAVRISYFKIKEKAKKQGLFK